MTHFIQGKATNETCAKGHDDHTEYKYLWQCQDCKRFFCGWFHSHDSNQGHNVICEDCEKTEAI